MKHNPCRLNATGLTLPLQGQGSSTTEMCPPNAVLGLVQMAEIKNLSAIAAVARSELNEIEEQLEECKAYRAFLDKVTPHDWFAEVRPLS